MKVLIINGPNLNMLGKREEKYGKATLEEIEQAVKDKARELAIEVDFFQSNFEGELINKIHSAVGVYDAIIINPGGLTHYSVSLRDALAIFKGKKIEVHLTNIFSREEYRKRTITGEAVDAVISGFGEKVYEIALISLGGEAIFED
ncbi:MAG: type II 3-dehydroquinate dehydratase [Actinobacteria bacterium]|nr:type II 3-dehydroquinate dehydratase [Actinomycetota bacterium]